MTVAFNNKCRVTEELCREWGIAFVPIVAESLRGWYKVAIEQFRKLGSALVRHSGQEEGEKIGNLVKRVAHLGNLVNRVVHLGHPPLHHQPLTHLPLLASVTVALPFPAPNLPPHLLLASATAAVSTSTESECELLITRQLVWHKLVLLCHFPPHSGLQGWRVDCCKIWDCCHFRSNNCNLWENYGEVVSTSCQQLPQSSENLEVLELWKLDDPWTSVWRASFQLLLRWLVSRLWYFGQGQHQISDYWNFPNLDF